MSRQTTFDFRPSLEERFEIWCVENPMIVSRIRSIALGLKRRGHKHWGMKGIFEYIRLETELREAGGTFKINNNYTSMMARKLMTEHPELDGFFETRQLRAS